jgi:hypothetical protein
MIIKLLVIVLLILSVIIGLNYLGITSFTIINSNDDKNIIQTGKEKLYDALDKKEDKFISVFNKSPREID